MSLHELIEAERATDSPELEEREAPSLAQVPAPSPHQPLHVEVEDRHAVCCYANFCRVTGTPEELILDFGLNSQPFDVPAAHIDVKQRLVVNYFTAKRMYRALHLAVQRHEEAFGVLEIDVQKRFARASLPGPGVHASP
jgi:hypothetical protein